MIAIRGIIRHKDDRKSPSSSSPPPPTVSSDDTFNPLTSKQGEWTWTGYWAFGSLPPAEVLDVMGQQKKKKLPIGVRPFVYKFQCVKDAKDVVVPSSLAHKYDDNEQEGDEGDIHIDHIDDDNVVHDADGNKNTVNKKNDDSNTNRNALKSEKNDSVDTKTEPMSKIDSEGAECKNTNENATEVPTNMDKDEKPENETNEKIAILNVETAADENNNAMEIDRPETDGLGNSEKDVNPKHMALTHHQQVEEERKESTEQHERKDRGAKSQTPITDVTKIDLKSDAPTIGESFGTMNKGDKYTDGGKTFPKRCPLGGHWKGYFENVSRRKDRMSSRVQEEFHLFINSTPPVDAQVKFDDNNNEKEDGNNNGASKNSNNYSLAKGELHVRGAGTNQFGTFEILGSYNIETGILACQKMYIITAEETSDQKKKDEKEKLTKEKKVLKKTYYTRKRPAGSWRTTSYGAYDDIYDNGSGRTHSGRKRQRTISEPSVKSSNTLSIETAEEASKEQNTAINSVDQPAGVKKLNVNTVTQKDLPVATNTTAVTTRRPSPNKSPSHRKPRASPSSVKSPSSVTSSTHQIKIPKSGNPLDAKWRAAHFFYFKRHVESNNDLSTVTNSSSAQSTTTTIVVYEGEMNQGRNLRSGRGVCLYSNGTIYEGEWKKNKEHGNGILLTGDRKRVIYAGEWERGKMHGRGTYYYHMYASEEDESDTKNGGMYVGEFKENARHGVGTYTLPGGDAYSGDWRENVPCGKGMFQWSDGSKYDGMWKDGKRNGYGELHCSDGFYHEGYWKDNAMEGRGKAIYPSGQRYDGMWLDGKRDGRGTIIFENGAVYKGRFKEDCMEGQGTLKIDRNVSVITAVKKQQDTKIAPLEPEGQIMSNANTDKKHTNIDEVEKKIREDWMIPIEFQSDIGRIHEKAGFTMGGE